MVSWRGVVSAHITVVKLRKSALSDEALRVCLAALLLCVEPAVSLGAAEIPRVTIAQSEGPRETVSSSFLDVRGQAISLQKAGDTTAALALLNERIANGSPSDAMAARLSAGYINYKAGDRTAARQLFASAAEMPDGINDRARGEAALRLAHLQTPELAKVTFEKLVRGEYIVSTTDRCTAAIRLGALLHREKKRKDAAAYYAAAADATSDTKQRVEALVELAGLWHELANGCLDAADQPAGWQRCRDICTEIVAMGDAAPRDRRMVADLMRFETFWFQKTYDTAYVRGKEFLERWNELDRSTLKRNEKKYLTTGRTFQLQAAFVTGHNDDALSIAATLMAEKPGKDEQFARSDAYLYAVAVIRVLTADRGDVAAQRDYDSMAVDHNPDTRYYRGVILALENRRAAYQLARQQ